MRICVDSSLNQFRGDLDFSALLSSLDLKLAAVGEHDLQEFPIDEAALLDELGERALERGLELLIAQDRHFLRMRNCEFLVALPDDSPILASGVPRFTAIGCAAVSTVNLASEHSLAPAVASCGEFCLGEFPRFRIDDGWVEVGHVILWHFAMIGFDLFGQEIHSIGFLQQSIALVFLVGEDGLDGGVAPVVFAPWC